MRGGGSVNRKDSCVTGAERGVFDDGERLKHVQPDESSDNTSAVVAGGCHRGGNGGGGGDGDGDDNGSDAGCAVQPDLLLLLRRQAAHQPLIARRCNICKRNVLLHALFPEFPDDIQQNENPNTSKQTPNLQPVAGWALGRRLQQQLPDRDQRITQC